jgi:hypothetical protein
VVYLLKLTSAIKNFSSSVFEPLCKTDPYNFYFSLKLFPGTTGHLLQNDRYAAFQTAFEEYQKLRENPGHTVDRQKVFNDFFDAMWDSEPFKAVRLALDAAGKLNK